MPGGPPARDPYDLPMAGGAVDLAALLDRNRSPAAPSGAIPVTAADGMLASRAHEQSWTAVQWLTEAERAMGQGDHFQRSLAKVRGEIRRMTRSASRKRIEQRRVLVADAAALGRQAHAALLAACMFATIASHMMDGSWRPPVTPMALAELRTQLEVDALEDRGEFAIRTFNLLAGLRGEPAAEQDRGTSQASVAARPS